MADIAIGDPPVNYRDVITSRAIVKKRTVATPAAFHPRQAGVSHALTIIARWRSRATLHLPISAAGRVLIPDILLGTKRESFARLLPRPPRLTNRE